jgi:predicted methyltransferase
VRVLRQEEFLLLSSHNCKALSGDVARAREDAARDSSRYTEEQLAFLEVGPGYPVRGDADRRRENFTVDIEAVDHTPLENTRRVVGQVDIRTLPGRMGEV